LVLLGWRVWVLEVRPALAAREAADPALAPVGAVEAGDYLSAARVERLRHEAVAAVAAVRALPADHAALVQSLVDLDRALAEGERRWVAGRLAPAWQQLGHVLNLAAAHRGLAEARAEAARLQGQFLDLLPAMEAARRQAPERYEQALAAAAVARGADEGGKFHAAAAGFARAVEAGVGLVEAADRWVDQQVLIGQRALGQGEGGRAREAFVAVLAVRPEHVTAQRGRDRAAVAAEVKELVEAAQAAKAEGDLAGAVAGFGRARERDPASVAAQQGLARAQAALRERDFAALLERAQTAAAAGGWDVAVATLEEAAAAHPERAEVAPLLEQVRDQAFRAQVREATRRGLEAEARRDWPAAQAAYSAALDLDGQFEPALQGLMRSGEVLRALVRYDRLLAEARALALRGSFVAAVTSFNQAMASKPDYLPLAEEVADLRGELERQSVPQQIRFLSDGQTHVTIAGYALLGQFRERDERILPGNYVVRGRRRGHRDVTHTLRVRAGEPLPPLTVSCTERVTSR